MGPVEWGAIPAHKIQSKGRANTTHLKQTTCTKIFPRAWLHWWLRSEGQKDGKESSERERGKCGEEGEMRGRELKGRRVWGGELRERNGKRGARVEKMGKRRLRRVEGEELKRRAKETS